MPRNFSELSYNTSVEKEYTGNTVALTSYDINLRYGTTATFVFGEIKNGIVVGDYSLKTEYRLSEQTTYTSGMPTNAGVYQIKTTIQILGRSMDNVTGGNIANSAGGQLGLITLTIAQKSIASTDITNSAVGSVTYNGNAFTPAPTITFGSRALTVNSDYTLSYLNNTNAGTATITVTGKGNFSGIRTINFTIAQATPTFMGNTLEVGVNQTEFLDVTELILKNAVFEWGGAGEIDLFTFEPYHGNTVVTSLRLGNGNGNLDKIYIKTSGIAASEGVILRFKGTTNYKSAYAHLTINTTCESGIYVFGQISQMIANGDEAQITGSFVATKTYFATVQEAVEYLKTADSTITQDTLFVKGDVTVGSVVNIESSITMKADEIGGKLIKATQGTAVFSVGGNLTVDGVEIDGKDIDGGIFSIESDNVNLTVKNSEITNAKNANGGVVSFKQNNLGATAVDAQITIENSTILNSTATENGGVIYLPVGNNLTLKDSTFTGNEASDGGVVFTEGGKISLTGGTFSDNTAQNGGVIAQTETIMSDITSEIVIENVQITDNTASGAKGGAIYLPSKAYLTVKGSTVFSTNTATQGEIGKGGAIYLTDESNFNLIDGTFSENSADFGGAIYVADSSNSSKGSFKIDGGSISNNGANIFGGGIVTESQQINLDGTNNTVGVTDEIGLIGGTVNITSDLLEHNVFIKFFDPENQQNARVDENGNVSLQEGAEPYVTTTGKLTGSELKEYFRVVNSGYTFNGSAEINGQIVNALFMQNSLSEVAHVEINGVFQTYYSLQQAINAAAAASSASQKVEVYLIQYQNDKDGTYSNEIEIHETLTVPENANISFSSLLKHTNAAGDNFVYERVQSGAVISGNQDESGTVAEGNYAPTTIKRADNLLYEMVSIEQNASLTIGESEYGNATTAGIIFDGGANFGGSFGEVAVSDDAKGTAGTAVTNNVGIKSNSPVIVNNGNLTINDGAAICNNGNLTINDGAAICNNENNSAMPGESFGSQYYGGGIRNQGNATLQMTGGTIENCYAREGGAILNINKPETSAYVDGGSCVTISGGTISGNASQMKGSAIQTIYGGAKTEITGGTIENNFSLADLGSLSVEEGGSLTINQTDKDLKISAGDGLVNDQTVTNKNAIYIYNKYGDSDITSSATRPFIEGKSAAAFVVRGSPQIDDQIHLDNPCTVNGTDTVFAPIINADNYSGEKLNVEIDANRPIGNQIVSGNTTKTIAELFEIKVPNSDGLSNRYTYTTTENGKSTINFGGYDLVIEHNQAGKVTVNGTADKNLSEITVKIGDTEISLKVSGGVVESTEFDLSGKNSNIFDVEITADYSIITGEDIKFNSSVMGGVEVVQIDFESGAITSPSDTANGKATYYVAIDNTVKKLTDGMLPNDILIDELGYAVFHFDSTNGGDGQEHKVHIGTRENAPQTEIKQSDVTSSSLTFEGEIGFEYNLSYEENGKTIFVDSFIKPDSNGKVVFDNLQINKEYQLVIRTQSSLSPSGQNSTLPSVTVEKQGIKTLTEAEYDAKIAFEKAYDSVKGEVLFEDKSKVYDALDKFEVLCVNEKSNVKQLKSEEYADLIVKAEIFAKTEIENKISELFEESYEKADEVKNQAFEEIESIQSGLNESGNGTYADLDLIVERANAKLEIIEEYQKIIAECQSSGSSVGILDLDSILNDATDEIDQATSGTTIIIAEIAIKNLKKEQLIVEVKSYASVNDSVAIKDVINQIIENCESEIDNTDSYESSKELADNAKLDIDKVRAALEIKTALAELQSISEQTAQPIVEKYIGNAEQLLPDTGKIAAAESKSAVEIEKHRAIAELTIENERAYLEDYVDFDSDGNQISDINADGKKANFDAILDGAKAEISENGESGATSIEIAAAVESAIANAQKAVDDYDENKFRADNDEIIKKTDITFSDLTAIDKAIDEFKNYTQKSQNEMNNILDELLNKKKTALEDYFQSFKTDSGAGINGLIDEIVESINLDLSGNTASDFAVNEQLDLIKEQGAETIAKQLIDEYVNGGTASEEVIECANENIAKIENLITPQAIPTVERIEAWVERAKAEIDAERFKDENPIIRVEFFDVLSGDLESVKTAEEKFNSVDLPFKTVLDEQAQTIGYDNFLDYIDDLKAKCEFEEKKSQTKEKVKEYVRTHDGESVLEVLDECLSDVDSVEYAEFTADNRAEHLSEMFENLEKVKEQSKNKIEHAQKQQRAENQIAAAIDSLISSEKYNQSQKEILENLIKEAKEKISQIEIGLTPESIEEARAKIDEIVFEIVNSAEEIPVTQISTGGLKPDLTPQDPSTVDYAGEEEYLWGVVSNQTSMDARIELVIKRTSSDKLSSINNAVKNDKLVVADGNNIDKNSISELFKDREIKTSLDIYLLKDGMVVREFNGAYTVLVLLPESMRNMSLLQVVYLADDGTVEVYETSVVDGKYLVFTTTHFSEFIVLGAEEVNLWWLIFILTAIIVAEIAVIMLLYFRKKTKKSKNCGYTVVDNSYADGELLISVENENSGVEVGTGSENSGEKEANGQGAKKVKTSQSGEVKE